MIFDWNLINYSLELDLQCLRNRKNLPVIRAGGMSYISVLILHPAHYYVKIRFHRPTLVGI